MVRSSKSYQHRQLSIDVLRIGKGQRVRLPRKIKKRLGGKRDDFKVICIYMVPGTRLKDFKGNYKKYSIQIIKL